MIRHVFAAIVSAAPVAADVYFDQHDNAVVFYNEEEIGGLSMRIVVIDTPYGQVELRQDSTSNGNGGCCADYLTVIGLPDNVIATPEQIAVEEFTSGRIYVREYVGF